MSTSVAAGIWGTLVGQAPTIDILQLAVGGHGMTHAWLFTGPPGSGRSNTAVAFAAALQCPDLGCGECAACHTALKGTHADVEVVTTCARDYVTWRNERPAGGGLERGGALLGRGRVHDEPAVHLAHPDGADGTIERHAGEAEGGRGAVHGQHVAIQNLHGP